MKNIKLIHGNAIHILRKIKNNSIDLIIADPPYDLSKAYGNGTDHIAKKHFLKFSKLWIQEAIQDLKHGGTIYIFMGMRMIAYIYIILNKSLTFQSWITWHYTQGVGKRKGFSSRHDDILMFTKSGSKPTFNLDAVRVPQKYYRKLNNMRGANPGNVWEISHVHYSQHNRSIIPTQKPEALEERMILASSNKGDLVLDPFSGSGTTMRVAQVTGRKGIGVELNSKYIKATRKRLQEPFHGFDSIDSRMLRIPSSLNDPKIRNIYFHLHIKWFLSNHTNKDIRKFIRDFKKKYQTKLTKNELKDIKLTVKRY